MQREMRISEKAARDYIELSKSESLRNDLDVLRHHRHNPFIKNGAVDIEAYLEFVQQFNEFINHKPKPFRPIIDKEMRL
jgi:hypothetical protein